jgi:LPXTG-motif cell wall-anchored protein
MIAEGHDVDNHSFSHVSFGTDHNTGTFTTREQAIDDLTRTSQAIFNVTGYWPWSFRAPFFQWGGANNILYGLDYELMMPFVGSQLDTNDWMPERTPQDIADTVLLHAQPAGGVILMHDCGGPRQRTVDSLAILIPEMQARGYAFVSTRELFYLTGTSPERFTDAPAMRTGGAVNAWAPSRNPAFEPLWADYPEWWNESWWTIPAPPWARNGMSDNPLTGVDTTNLIFPAIGLVVSLFGLFGAIILKKRR